MKINLGGGNERIPGFTNVDILPLPNVDIVCDLNGKLPLADNSIEEIYASHILEHLPNTVKIVEELYRICQPGATIKIKSPYFKSDGAFKDPTHVSFFTEQTFDYFDRGKILTGQLPDYCLKANLQLKKIAYIWSHRWIRFLPAKKFFLRHCWNIARTIYYELEVIK